MSELLLRGAEVEGRLLDMRLDGGVIAEIGPGLPRHEGEAMLDAAGGALRLLAC